MLFHFMIKAFNAFHCFHLQLVVYFNQLSGSAPTWRWWKYIFCHFLAVFRHKFFFSTVFLLSLSEKKKNVKKVFCDSFKLVDTQALVDSLRGYPFFLLSRQKNEEHCLKEGKLSEKDPKKYFYMQLGLYSTQNLVKIHNSVCFCLYVLFSVCAGSICASVY